MGDPLSHNCKEIRSVVDEMKKSEIVIREKSLTNNCLQLSDEKVREGGKKKVALNCQVKSKPHHLYELVKLSKEIEG